MSISNETISRVLIGYRGYLTAYVWSIVRDEHLVEDVLQEAAAVALNRASEIENEAALVVWMRTTCRHLALAAARKHTRFPRLLGDEAMRQIETAWDDLAPEPDADRLDALRLCLSKLSPKAKTLVRLKYIEGLGTDAIARQQKIKPDSVYVSMSRIIGRLRDCMRRQRAHVHTDPGGSR